MTERLYSRALSLDGVAELDELAINPTVDKAVESVRELLGVELAYATRFSDGLQYFHRVRGDGASFGVRQDDGMPLGETYCERIIEGRLPNLIPDVRAEDRASSLAITDTADVGAFTSVPLIFSDGSFYGTLCAISHQAKPEWGYRELQFLRIFARMIADQLEREGWEQRTFEIERAAHELEVQAAAATALIGAVEARDAYTAGHSRAVVDHAAAVADLLGLAGEDRAQVKNVALLHDIGKISVPDSILHKAGPLTEAEWSVMRQHPVASEQLVSGVPGLRHLAPMVRAEHERWDGEGYPDGLRGEEIPLASRITLVCDAFHAMTSDRPYRRAMPQDEACTEIEASLGVQFCPTAGRALLSILAGE
jgi:HD-GYP domain-containing protein (c-di-GMP phosphodiesterase class II)